MEIQKLNAQLVIRQKKTRRELSNFFSKIYFRLFIPGVPNGSVLGTLLCLLFTADLPFKSQCNRAVYADDCITY